MMHEYDYICDPGNMIAFHAVHTMARVKLRSLVKSPLNSPYTITINTMPPFVSISLRTTHNHWNAGLKNKLEMLFV